MADSTVNNVLIVTHGFPPTELGGTELYSYNLARCLSDRGIRTSIFTRHTRPVSKGDSRRDTFVAESYEGIRVRRVLHSTADFREIINPRVAEAFRRVVAEEKPEIIHFQHLIFLSADLPEIAAALNLPSVMTFHDSWFICPKVLLLNRENAICEGPRAGAACATCFDDALNNRGDGETTYASKAFEFSNRLCFLRRQMDLLNYKISPSLYLIDRYSREGFNDITNIPLGLPPVPRVGFKPSGVLRIGYMGNINYSKGLSVAVRELAPLLAKKKVTLVVYGHPYDQRYFDEIKTAVRRFPSGAVELHGRYRNTFEELWRIFSSFDVLVFPSVWEENSPLVVREALLAGRPVIGSHLGGVPETVKDGVNGFIFNPFVRGDLEDKIRKLLAHPELLYQLWEGARNTQIESIEDHADKMIRVYEDVINHSAKNPPGVRQ